MSDFFFCSPRYNSALARRVAALGGLAAMVLTHRDDVADHAQWAERWVVVKMKCNGVLSRKRGRNFNSARLLSYNLFIVLNKTKRRTSMCMLCYIYLYFIEFRDARFQCPRWIHEDDADAAPGAENLVSA